MKLKKGDHVIVLSGKHRGEEADVLTVLPGKNAVILDTVNIVKRHVRPGSTGKRAQSLGQHGIIDKFMPMDASDVALWCSKHGGPCRIGYKVEKGKKVRVCRKCGAEL
jgi:large subunit ribosomal protein L24